MTWPAAHRWWSGRARVLAAAVLALLLGLAPRAASAHATILSSTPRAGEPPFGPDSRTLQPLDFGPQDLIRRGDLLPQPREIRRGQSRSGDRIDVGHERRGPQSLERGAHGLGVTENAHINASVAQIRAGLDIRDGHKSDPRVLHFMGEHVAEDLSHGLVDTTHPLQAHPIPPASSNEVRLRSMRTPSG